MNLSLAETAFPLRLRQEVPMTDDELLSFCAANDSFKVERDANGELIVMTPAGGKSGKMNLRIGRFLDEWAEQDGRGVAFDSSAGFHLPDGSVRAADAAWVVLPRWNALTDQQQSKFVPLCPDFIIELRSPSDKLPALRKKMQQWVTNGVLVAWLIDPFDKTVSIYRPNHSPEVHNHPTSVQGDGIMAGFELVMARIWD